MINWIEILNNEFKSNKYLEEEKKLLLKTAKAANLLNDKIFTYSLDNIINFCKEPENNIKLKMYDFKIDELNPGFKQIDWLKFFNIEEINQKIKEIQRSILNFNKEAALVTSSNTGDIKHLKDIVGIQAKSIDKQDQIFVYTNVESLFEENKEPITHICENCNYEFLCIKTFIKLK